MDILNQFVLPHLPPDIQALLLNPPNINSPSSLLTLGRILLPYTKYIVVLLAFYIVWSTLTGLFGYFSRFLRFSMRIGPIIGLIAWVMSNSGQGGLDELMQAGKEWVGLAQPGDRGGGTGWSPGIASLFGMNSNTRTRAGGGRKKAPGGGGGGGLGGLFGGTGDPISGRTRSQKTKSKKSTSDAGLAGAAGDAAGDFLSSMLNSATGGEARDGEGGGMVEDFVKSALAKAAGLEWLLRGGASDEEGDKRSTRTR